MIEIKSKQELEKILEENKGGSVVLDFHASWCGPCKKLGRTIEELEKNGTDIMFVGADVEEADEELVNGFKVRNIPLVVYYKNGEETERTVGSVTKEELLKKA